MNGPFADVLSQAVAMRVAGGPMRACLVVGARGSTPQPAGAMMLVDQTGTTFGTIGGGCVEAELTRRAMAMLLSDTTGVHDFILDHDYGWDDGLICGGTLHVAIGTLPEADELAAIEQATRDRVATRLPVHVQTEEGSAHFDLQIPPRPRLLIAGGGHIGQAVARHGLRLDFETVLYDDRADLLERYAPDGCHTVSGEMAESLADAVIDTETYCVIVTRGHRHDAQALAAVIDRGARYVGMIGSKRKVLLVRRELMERGISESSLDTVHAPIGVDIGSVTGEEISLSIAAQLVQVREQRGWVTVEGPHLDSPQ
ncbi:MAG: XdhC family protein [Phycisphaerales bacterium]|nr:XdhC family protein [Phycisphaerales bacterium]MDP7188618.1 XdhC family protein [Phycisphaerales bacterium]